MRASAIVWKACILPALVTLSGGQNLIPDPSFESGVVPGCFQGFLPDTWFQAGNASPGADTYSLDCATAPGLAPEDFGNFSTITSAARGLRFCAGGRVGTVTEALGTALVAPLAVGRRYELTGSFTLGTRADILPGHYDVWLSPSGSGWQADGVLVGTIGGLAVGDVWTPDRLTFDAPADAAYLVLDPVSQVAGTLSYVGLDDLALRRLPRSPVRRLTPILEPFVPTLLLLEARVALARALGSRHWVRAPGAP